MFSPLQIVFTVVCYVGALFVLAQIAERNHAAGRQWAQSPVVYALGLGVYCTTWTFYGSVGNASGNGMLWLTIYLGPTLSLMLAPTLLRRIVRLKHVHRITSIADFISARYAKSQAVAALVTSMLLVGIVPYIALQLKAVTGTFLLITKSAEGGDASSVISPIVIALMLVFTVMFGIRRLDPTERHPGMMVSLAAESVVKLVASLAVGIFVVVTIFGNVGGFLDKLDAGFPKPVILLGEANGSQLLTWFVYLLLATFAFMLLPRQFHVGVIEHSDDKQIKTAMWLTPTYLLAMNLCVLPIALAGMLVPPGTTSDQFVLSLPMAAGQKTLSLFVFIGGFSAAIGMIMVETMTMATMVGNHLILPVIEANKSLWRFRRHLLYARWVAAAILIGMSYGFEVGIGESAMLVSIGMLSFAAVTQFAPAIIGGLFWSRASRGGALLGLSIAFATWTYTLFLPTFVRSGWLAESFLTEGPLGIGALRPEALLGVSGISGIAHGTLWTTGLNIVGFLVGSLFFAADATERQMADEFLAAGRPQRIDGGEAIIPLAGKRDAVLELLMRYYPRAEAEALVGRVLTENKLTDKENITALELTELHASAEHLLAGALGAASAHQAIGQLRAQTTSQESKALEKVYTRLLANLQMAPSELRRRIDFMTERETLLKQQAEELQARIDARTKELQAAQKELLETAHRAGRAEIATNVLHNVGNVLNSINVSVTTSMETIATSQMTMLPRVTKMLDDHKDHLGDFLTKDAKGKQLPLFLDKLVQHLMKERDKLETELKLINKSVDHIKAIVTVQQSYAGVSAVWESVALAEIIDDAVRVNASGLDQNHVGIVRRFESLPPQMIQKHKVLQILVNVVSNAKHAVAARHQGGGTITLTLSAVDGKAQISCSDSGIGISAENLDRLFRHGFTTKKDGHGFGLHSAVLAAREMGGDLTASSEGEGKGATFTLTLPLKPAAQKAA